METLYYSLEENLLCRIPFHTDILLVFHITQNRHELWIFSGEYPSLFPKMELQIYANRHTISESESLPASGRYLSCSSPFLTLFFAGTVYDGILF